ncbi:MAG: hypothetical protein ACLSCV_05500 [Acutalibacteraceae bacterium]
MATIPEDENHNGITTEKEFRITEQINVNPDTPTNPRLLTLQHKMIEQEV